MTDTQYESIIADAMKDVATEIRLTDAYDLVALVQSDRPANVADFVNSSTEMFFKSGTIRYSLSAECNVSWQDAPEIRLDMEFCHAQVCAFFRLILGRRLAGIELVDIMFDDDNLDDQEKMQRLSRAIDDARLMG